MTRRTSAALIALLVVAGLSIAWIIGGGVRTGENATLSLQQEWFPYAGYAGEVEAKRIAAQDGVSIEILPGSEAVDPIKLVMAGAADFGVASADLLISAKAKGADLVCIGVINDISPTCFLVRPDSGIKRPSDFVGHKVGILTGTNTERIYELMMAHEKVDRSKIEEIPVPFDLQTFVLGQYDVRPAFAYDEPISLSDKGIAYEIIKPSDFGVHFLGTVYFTRSEVIKKHPEKVQQLIDYLVKGWRSALKDPATAIDTLAAQFEGVDKSRELKALKAGEEYFRGAGDVLLGSDANWQETISGLEELGDIKPGSVKPQDVRNESFIKAAVAK